VLVSAVGVVVGKKKRLRSNDGDDERWWNKIMHRWEEKSSRAAPFRSFGVSASFSIRELRLIPRHGDN